MQVKIETLNDDLVIRIPRHLADEVHIAAEAIVDVSVDDGVLIVQPPGYKRKQYSIAELAEQITDENRHDPVDWGPPMGREVW
jgi:antitoxin MazE